MAARYGKTKPYSQTVINTTNQSEEENPRNENQVEPAKQVFALYSFNSSTLYLSKTQKKSFIQEYLQNELNKDVVVKGFFRDVDEFVKQIKSVEKIKFISKSNLFTADGSLMKIFPNPKDLFGLGLPADFTLETNFSSAIKTEKFVEILKTLVSWKTNAEADSLLCIGRDDKNLETIYNTESLIQKISVKVDTDDQGLYRPEEIKHALIKEIQVSK